MHDDFAQTSGMYSSQERTPAITLRRGLVDFP